ncbi:MAG: leucine-rich repeat domain-containing protein, partial [Clostridia bacterium]
ESFRGTSSLTQITIPEGTTSIQGRAFNTSGIKSIVIPGTVETIGWLAFVQSALSEVVICNGVKTIADSAFRETKLKTVIIPGSVKTIGTGAFYQTPLTEITIQEGVETIGDRAFWLCGSLKNIDIPQSVISIDDGTFGYCGGLQQINVDVNNPNYMSEDGVLYNKDKTKIIKYPAKKSETIFEIPNTVKEIGEYCFQNCKNIVQIEVPDQVEKLGVNTFLDTSNLQQINVATTNGYYLSDNGVLYNKDKTEIIRYPQAKEGTTYNIPSTVKTIKQNCFYGSKISEITIPGNVESIESNAFQCGINYVTCEEGLKTIGTYVFFNGGLKTITLPSTLETIGEKTFAQCYSLTSITINKAEGSISGSPWGASASVPITWTGE